MVKIFLPLLFADGQPTSLEKITLNQMERFVPFMLSCCPDYSGNTPPAWWPSLVAYRFPLCSVGNSQQRATCYKELISRCYEFHKCEHVLRFCSRLAEIPPDLLQYKENAHDFVSIYNTVNNKLIVTYKKKNQIYDRPPASPFKSLLPKIYKTNQPPTDQHIEDIYLCNYCDEEFTSGKEAIAHESVCTGKVDDKLLNNEALDQVSAMRYFGLGPCNEKALIATPSKRGTSIRLTARSYMPIPISSPLGLKMSSNVTLLDEGDKLSCVRKVENLCKAMKTCTESLSKRPKRIGGNPRFMKRKFRSSIWVHTYCFNKAQREEKMTTLRTGLNKQARLLLEKCKPAVVLIEKLPLLDPLALHAAASLNFPTSSLNGAKLKEEAEEIIPSEAQDEICVDLTYGEGSIYSNNIEDCTYSSSSSDSFFYSSSSNHKRPSIDDWGSLFSMKPLLQV